MGFLGFGVSSFWAFGVVWVWSFELLGFRDVWALRLLCFGDANVGPGPQPFLKLTLNLALSNSRLQECCHHKSSCALHLLSPNTGVNLDPTSLEPFYQTLKGHKTKKNNHASILDLSSENHQTPTPVNLSLRPFLVLAFQSFLFILRISYLFLNTGLLNVEAGRRYII